MRKFGKEIKLNLYENYSTTIGCVNNSNPKSVYLEISSWFEPISESNLNYNRIISDLNKKIKQEIYNHFYHNQQCEFLIDRTIVDLDIRESGVKFGKRSYMSCEITLFPKIQEPITSLNIQKLLINIVDIIIESSFKNNKYFNCYKRKRDVQIA